MGINPLFSDCTLLICRKKNQLVNTIVFKIENIKLLKQLFSKN